MISNQYLAVLQKIHTILRQRSVLWAVTGSLNFALHGIPVTIHDIDIQTNKEGAYKFEQLFTKYITKKVTYMKSEKIRSYFGSFLINNIPVEIMGDLQKILDDGSWEEPVNIRDYLEFIKFKGMKIPVLCIEYEEHAYRQMGRIEKADLLRRYLVKSPKK
jgi:hypothetical protein